MYDRGMASPTSASLPHPRDLERICRGLATLDAIMSSEWEARYYSFNAAWDPAAQVRMASMRNGSGDDWFIAFTPHGTFVKAFWHEHPLTPAATVYAGLPAALQPQRDEPAFTTDQVTWGGWHDGSAWTLRGDPAPLADELAMLAGDAAAYRDYAAAYFEATVPLEVIVHVLAGAPLDASIVASVNDERSLAELRADLVEIGY